MHIDYSDAHSLFQMVVEPFCNLAQQMATSVATKDAMIAVGIDILLKVLICLHQKCKVNDRFFIIGFYNQKVAFARNFRQFFNSIDLFGDSDIFTCKKFFYR